jgi:hypothetical protein
MKYKTMQQHAMVELRGSKQITKQFIRGPGPITVTLTLNEFNDVSGRSVTSMFFFRSTADIKRETRFACSFQSHQYCNVNMTCIWRCLHSPLTQSSDS